MSYIGNKKINDVFVGNNKVSKVYIGNTLVYQQQPTGLIAYATAQAGVTYTNITDLTNYTDTQINEISKAISNCVDITNALIKIEEYLEKEKLEDQNKMIRQNCSEICTLFEVNLGRSLSPVEVKIISDNSKFYKKSDFENAIFEISKENDVTVNQCIDYLKKGKTKERKVDKENEKAILDFFESINKKS